MTPFPARRCVHVCALFALVAVVATFAVNSRSATAGDYDFEKFTVRTSSWTGHGIGSMVHRRTTQDMKIPQMPGGGRKTVTEEKETLVAITETHYVIKVETKAGPMGWRTTERREPKVVRMDLKRAQVKDAGEESITIKGKTFVCQKKTVADMGAFIASMGGEIKGRGGRSVPVGSGAIWVHPTHGVLKTSATMSMMGQKLTTTMTATQLSVTKAVGGKDYTCREWTLEFGGMGGTRVSLQTPAIPGQTVVGTMTMSQQGFSMKTTEEIVSYVKKPVGATTPSAKKPPAKAPAKPATPGR